jgi:hypothetical protein
MNLTSVIIVAISFVFIFGFIAFRFNEIKSIIIMDNKALRMH